MEQFKDAVSFRNSMTLSLMRGPCYAIFQKKDGTLRHMVCTLHNQLIPQDTNVDHTANKTYKQRSDKSVSVYDLEKREWRSFLLDNVKFFGELNKMDEETKKSLKEKYNA